MQYVCTQRMPSRHSFLSSHRAQFLSSVPHASNAQASARLERRTIMTAKV
jgi:hypothetical protein